MSNVKEDLKYLSDEYESGEHVDISAQNYFQDALDEIERLEGILHRVANHMREVDDAVSVARRVARTVDNMLVVGPFVELIDWYTWNEGE